MAELKIYNMDNTSLHDMCNNNFYRKSEADKVIADLEESHKKEVEQLLIEIVKSKADYREACDRLQTANLIKDEQLAATRHHKYKRCLGRLELCDSKIIYYGRLVSEVVSLDLKNERRLKVFKRFNFYKRWHQTWMELAEKFNRPVGQRKIK